MKLKPLLSSIGVGIYAVISLSLIGLWIIGARHTYYAHNDKAFYISLTPPGGWYWGVECFLHPSEDNSEPTKDSLITPEPTAYVECNGDRYITTELANYSNNEEKGTILYLHWKLQKAMLIAYRDSAIQGVSLIMKSKNYDEMMHNANYFRAMFFTKTRNISDTKTIPELRNLYSVLYCYYEFWQTLFLSFLDITNKTENSNEAKNKLENTLVSEDPKENSLIRKAQEEIDRLDNVYKISKKSHN